MSQELVRNVPLDAAQVKAYLEAHPAFFEREADFLASIRLQHPQRGSISLLDRQLEKLRAENQQLREEITELISIARQNETTYKSFCALYLALLPCNSINEVQQRLQSNLMDTLGLSAICMWPLSGQKDWVPRRKPVDHEALAHLIRRRLGENPFYLGRLVEEECELLFDDGAVGSVALMTLEDEAILLGFASEDPAHFNPMLEVKLLSLLRYLVSAVLRQFREQRHG